MSTTEQTDLELIRTAVRDLSRKFDFEYWLAKDRKHEYQQAF